MLCGLQSRHWHVKRQTLEVDTMKWADYQGACSNRESPACSCSSTELQRAVSTTGDTPQEVPSIFLQHPVSDGQIQIQWTPRKPTPPHVVKLQSDIQAHWATFEDAIQIPGHAGSLGIRQSLMQLPFQVCGAAILHQSHSDDWPAAPAFGFNLLCCRKMKRASQRLSGFCPLRSQRMKRSILQHLDCSLLWDSFQELATALCCTNTY